MSKLPILGIVVLMALVVSGYVSSNPNEEAQANDAVIAHLDPHVSYYQQHLASMGITASIEGR